MVILEKLEKFRKRFNAVNCIEPLVFVILLMVSLVPVLEFPVFVTMDGPAHLYNSQIIKSMITENGGIYEQYFAFNIRPEPNLLGHVMITAFLFIFEPLVAEKLVMILYVIGFLIGFRYMVSAFKNTGLYSSYFGFAFVYTHPIHLGFYNFGLGLVGVFFLVGFWLRFSQRLNVWRGLQFSALLLVCFFTHISTFAFSLIAIGMIELVWLIRTIFNLEIGVKTLFLRYAKLLLLVLPTLLLCIVFVLNHGGDSIPANSTPFFQQLESLSKIGPITIFSLFWEEPITAKLFPAIVGMVILVFLLDIFRNKKGTFEQQGKNQPFTATHSRHILLGLSGIFLSLYFILPNEVSSGGYVHVRLVIMFFLFLFLWLATARVPLLIALCFIVLIQVTNQQLFNYRRPFAKEHNALVRELLTASEHMKEGSIVLPIFETHHWFYGHISNYLAMKKPLIVLDNYEAVTQYFPLVWNMDPSPHFYLPLPSRNFCFSDIKRMEHDLFEIDVIVHYQENTPYVRGYSCERSFEELFELDYDLIHTSISGKLKVYRKKENEYVLSL